MSRTAVGEEKTAARWYRPEVLPEKVGMQGRGQGGRVGGGNAAHTGSVCRWQTILLRAGGHEALPVAHHARVPSPHCPTPGPVHLNGAACHARLGTTPSEGCQCQVLFAWHNTPVSIHCLSTVPGKEEGVERCQACLHPSIRPPRPSQKWWARFLAVAHA